MRCSLHTVPVIAFAEETPSALEHRILSIVRASGRVAQCSLVLGESVVTFAFSNGLNAVVNSESEGVDGEESEGDK